MVLNFIDGGLKVSITSHVFVCMIDTLIFDNV